jgi:uncharacterized protein (DUF58 family)
MSDTPRPHELFGFDSAFLQKLSRLAILTRRPVSGPAGGARRSLRHGNSQEFADFRNYAHGDDFRRVDWKAYARLDRLFLRLYGAEQMGTVTLFLDHSQSMGFGQPAKILTAARLAAILAYVALQRYDRVGVVGWTDAVDTAVPARGGKTSIPRIWEAIAGLAGGAAGSTRFEVLREYARAHPGRGVAMVFSDLLTDSDWRSGLRALRAAGLDVNVIQVLGPDEIRPDLRGDWVLVDSEGGLSVEVTASPRLLHLYEQELQRHTDDIREFCRRQNMTFLQISSDMPVEDYALLSLQGAGLIA